MEQLSDLNDVLKRLQNTDQPLAQQIAIAFEQEQAKRQSAEAELKKLRDRLAGYAKSSKKPEEIVMNLLVSSSMNKSSCIDVQELKEVLSFALAEAASAKKAPENAI